MQSQSSVLAMIPMSCHPRGFMRAIISTHDIGSTITHVTHNSWQNKIFQMYSADLIAWSAHSTLYINWLFKSRALFKQRRR